MTSGPDTVGYKQDMHQAMWVSFVYVAHIILAMTSRERTNTL